MNNVSKIIEMFPAKKVKTIAVELDVTIGFVKDILYKYGLIETKVRSKNHVYGQKKFVRNPTPEREPIQRAAW